MSLTETINQQLKAAMLASDKIRLETLRSIRALILEFEKSGIDRSMTPEDEIKILTSAAKKRKDAIEAFDAAGRTEVADKERTELAIIQEFLPAQMSDDDIRAELQTVIDAIGASSPSDVGKVMGAAMKTLKGKADGTVIQRIAKELLGAS
jgi:uncharacterized protein YqeY